MQSVYERPMEEHLEHVNLPLHAFLECSCRMSKPLACKEKHRIRNGKFMHQDLSLDGLEEDGGLITAGESSKSSVMSYSKASSSDKEEELISASASDSRDCKTVFSNGGRTAIGRS
ncbi:hypothetical protein AVEN_258807-1 [Araneus ventricosus]|uniref:Uncharacterized protein n=1 Tax=Araneus ventricosus TaxID=182803 RepID=A0A4Y2AL81_ARAVE|nr:hypothetical protein AVEN_258807-1 [Araneus ventricosus]